MNDQPKESCCPYCDGPVFEGICKPCGATIVHCAVCGRPLPKNALKCPECGAPRPEDKKEK